MAHMYGTGLFCLTLFWLASSNPAFAESFGGSCNKKEDCTSINNSTCNSNSTCVCESDFVAHSTKKTCLPVVKEEGSACEEKIQCSELGALFDCVDNKCTSSVTVKNGVDSQNESGNRDQCTDHTCYAEDEKKSPCANENCTTSMTPSAKRAESTAHHTAKEGGKTAEKKSSGGSSVVQISFLAVIWAVHLVM